MARKVILLADPGIDAAFAIVLALADPNLDVLAVLPTAGNISATQATANVHILLDRLDPPKRPRSADALPVEYDLDGTLLHGADGLGNTHFSNVQRHSTHMADRVLGEVVRESPREVSIICLGPATTLAHTLDRDPELAHMIDRVVLVGGAWREPGDCSPRAEFHFILDPESVRRLLRSGLHPVILPVDVSRKLVLSPTEILDWLKVDSRSGELLRQIVPYGLLASAELYGVEGLPLQAALGVVALALPGAVQLEERAVDIETVGELTRGMLVVEDRAHVTAQANAWIGADLALGEVRQYVSRGLAGAD